ncbi:hypothetical protein F4802DRAFT_596577 [Xylaria palmicola]|nr:hypothetical protein F4802DRAFT_596577 [Xylaria palmicola]
MHDAASHFSEPQFSEPVFLASHCSELDAASTTDEKKPDGDDGPHLPNPVDGVFAADHMDQQARHDELSRAAVTTIDQFEPEHALPGQAALHNFVTALVQGIAAAYQDHDDDDDGMGLLSHPMRLGVQERTPVVVVEENADLALSRDDRRAMQACLADTLRRVLGQPDGAAFVPRKLDLVWEAGKRREVFSSIDLGDQRAFDLAGSLRDAGCDSMSLHDLIRAYAFSSGVEAA